ncbi:MAG: OmpA family protein [Alphaproteobacteria bacterium]|nr:OmpA family protein [Alphaproteobacteria bacterium]
MIKKLALVATLALLTSACSGTMCKARGCKVVVSDSVVAAAAGTNAPVLFEFDSATLTPAGEAALAGYVDQLKNSDKSYTIVGYTDDMGSEEYNLGLSKRRAESTKAYFVKNGVDGKKLATVGKGETNFVASNDTAQGRAQNRRIEIETN